MSQKPILFLDIVGTLLLERGGEMEIAPYAQSFIDGVRHTFDLRFLTSLEEHHAKRVGARLGIDAEFVPFRHALGKSSAIPFAVPFYWVDDDPTPAALLPAPCGSALVVAYGQETPADLLRLSDERCSDRLIPVNRREGVTEATLAKLLATYAEHREEDA